MDSNDEGEGGWDDEPDPEFGLTKKYSEAQSFKTKDFAVWTIDQIGDRQKINSLKKQENYLVLVKMMQ